MARMMDRLTALKVAHAFRTPGMYAGGGGLYLQVTEGGASWIYRYMLKGVAREMGLGPLALYGLKEARVKALDARRLRHEGHGWLAIGLTCRTTDVNTVTASLGSVLRDRSAIAISVLSGAQGHHRVPSPDDISYPLGRILTSSPEDHALESAVAAIL